ncbi:hypothetical protein BV22DRAFT_1036854 [Leucogyrophana mollusca]|uniref:Uncharacterized protein n=1 Tax=Leucogyrophana mollusca TaxID=85980 RepID=A0ACB8BBD1_9AGAM|nr:hypothetical protein BV22DRAFT_1036854 [Leucogyrophana mollusca]
MTWYQMDRHKSSRNLNITASLCYHTKFEGLPQSFNVIFALSFFLLQLVVQVILDASLPCQLLLIPLSPFLPLALFSLPLKLLFLMLRT